MVGAGSRTPGQRAMTKRVDRRRAVCVCQSTGRKTRLRFSILVAWAVVWLTSPLLRGGWLSTAGHNNNNPGGPLHPGNSPAKRMVGQRSSRKGSSSNSSSKNEVRARCQGPRPAAPTGCRARCWAGEHVGRRPPTQLRGKAGSFPRKQAVTGGCAWPGTGQRQQGPPWGIASWPPSPRPQQIRPPGRGASAAGPWPLT